MPNETVTRRDAEYIDAQGITIHYSVWAPAQPKAVVQLAHGVGELFAVLLGQLDGATRQWVLVGAAAGPEQGDGPGVRLLQLDLGEAGVVAAPLVEAQRRGMAGVAEDDGL